MGAGVLSKVREGMERRDIVEGGEQGKVVLLVEGGGEKGEE